MSYLKSVFMKFLNYSNKFDELNFQKSSNKDEFDEAINKKKSRFNKIREELDSIEELGDFDVALLWNMQPNTIDEAIAYLPSLKKFKDLGEERIIQQAIDIIAKNSPMDYN